MKKHNISRNTLKKYIIYDILMTGTGGEDMNYNEYKTKAFAKNPEVKAEYDALGPQYEIIRAEIQSRKAAGITQKDLAERMGTAQANISRFESGNYNPSLAFLQRMAESLGKTLRISLE